MGYKAQLPEVIYSGLTITGANVLFNKDGTDASAEGAGILIEGTGGSSLSSFTYLSSLNTWKMEGDGLNFGADPDSVIYAFGNDFEFMVGAGGSFTWGIGGIGKVDFNATEVIFQDSVHLEEIQTRLAGQDLPIKNGSAATIAIFRNDLLVTFANGIRLANATDTTDGNIRWTGTDFEGRKSGVWTSMTGSGAGTVTGTGTNTQVTYWTGAGTISADAGLTYNDSTDILTITGGVITNGYVRVGTTADTTDGNIRWTGTDFEGRKSGAWVSMTGSGAGTVTGTGSNGRVTFWTGSGTISSDTGLLFDSSTDTLTTGQLVSSGVRVGRVATAVSYLALVTDYIISVTSTAAPRTISLPPASTAGAGRMYVIKDESGAASATNYIRIDPDGADTIDGVTTLDITVPYGVGRIYCNGTSWFTM